MVNTELAVKVLESILYYNILNIVVNTEHKYHADNIDNDYNILNIVVNTEHTPFNWATSADYNILNIVVNTELEF